MHLFCIKPFHSDNSPWAADKYKFQRLHGPILYSTWTYWTREPHFLRHNKALKNGVALCDEDVKLTHSNKVLVRETLAEDLHPACLFHLFFTRCLYSQAFEMKPWSKYISLRLTFSLCKQANTGPLAPLDSRSNYLEKAAMLQVQEGMLITLVDTQDVSLSFSFVHSLYGVINYETIHRWSIWEQEMFKPFFFPSHVHSN